MTIDSANDNVNIERCTANEKYSLIPNEISQHPTISCDAQAILTYLLSCKPDWVIKPKNVWKAKNISRNRVYKAFDELAELGYMEIETKFKHNLKQTVHYRVAFYPKYLSCGKGENLDAENNGSRAWDTETREPEPRYGLISNIPKKYDQEKKNNNSSAVEEAQAPVVVSPISHLNIEPDLKAELEREYTLEALQQAVDSVNWSTARSHPAVLRAALKGKYEAPRKKKDISKENKAKAIFILQPFFKPNMYNCWVGPIQVEINREEIIICRAEGKSIPYTDPSMERQLEELIEQVMGT